MDIKELAEQMTNEQFYELIARRMIIEGIQSRQHFLFEEQIEDETEEDALESVVNTANYSFYDGMHREITVSVMIDKVVEQDKDNIIKQAMTPVNHGDVDPNE